MARLQYDILFALMTMLTAAVFAGCSRAPDIDARKPDARDTVAVRTASTEPKRVAPAGLEVATEHRLGVLPVGVKMPVSMPVTNRTKSTVRLAFSFADCGCISEVDSLILSPGERGELVFSLHTTREGPIRRQVVYKLSGLRGASSLPISLVGECRGRLVSPSLVELGTVKPGDSREVVLELASSEHNQWRYASIRQTGGLTQSAVSADEVNPHKLRIPVKIPAVSSNGLRWFYELEFTEDGGSHSCTAPVTITCSVSNELFVEATLYLGVIDPSSQRVIERQFKLRKADIDLDAMLFEGEGDASLSITQSQSRGREATIRLELDENVEVGMHSATLKTASGHADAAAVEIPVTWMVLP